MLTCKDMLTISPVCLSQALYTLPQVPSPSSSKILYLENRSTALGSPNWRKENKNSNFQSYKIQSITNELTFP